MSVIAEDRKIWLVASAILNSRITRGKYPAISASWDTFRKVHPNEASELEADAKAALVGIGYFYG